MSQIMLEGPWPLSAQRNDILKGSTAMSFHRNHEPVTQENSKQFCVGLIFLVGTTFLSVSLKEAWIYAKKLTKLTLANQTQASVFLLPEKRSM